MNISRSLTLPYHELWLDAYAYAEDYWWSQIRQNAPDLFIANRSSSRASNLHDLAVRYIVQHGDQATFSDGWRFFAQVITGPEGTVIVRFKLLDADFMTANHPSGQQDVLAAQAVTVEMLGQLDLDFVPDNPTILTCGYQLAPDQMSISSVSVVCHYLGNVTYRYDVKRGGGMEVLDLPGLGGPEGPPPADLRSRRRPAKEDGGPEA